jgi:hypothetical protein
MPTRKSSHDSLLVALELIDHSVDRLALAEFPELRSKLGSAMAQILEVIDSLRRTTSGVQYSSAIAKRLEESQLTIFTECMLEVQELEAKGEITAAIERCTWFLAASGSIKLRSLTRNELHRLKNLSGASR